MLDVRGAERCKMRGVKEMLKGYQNAAPNDEYEMHVLNGRCMTLFLMT